MKPIINNKNIKAILVDSGRVLNGPTTGHWFITPNFFNYVNKKKFKALDKKLVNNAFSKAGEYIWEQNYILNEEEEYAHFTQYYKIFSTELPALKLTDELIKAIAEDLVYNYSKYKFYKDAIKVIPELSKNYKLAVVSDAWPSLENVFKQAGLRDYFSSFVISSIKGVTKPNESMYKIALEELKVLPEEAIFIDDNIKNCQGARKLGIKSYLLCRDWKVYFYSKTICKNNNVIQNLYDVKKILSNP